jgi:hypothetical protein
MIYETQNEEIFKFYTDYQEIKHFIKTLRELKLFLQSLDKKFEYYGKEYKNYIYEFHIRYGVFLKFIMKIRKICHLDVNVEDLIHFGALDEIERALKKEVKPKLIQMLYEEELKHFLNHYG